jgi:hypothetical protein
MELASVREVTSNSSAEALAACTRLAFCWVIWSSWATAWPTWSSPELCSEDAALISAMMLVTRLTACTTSSMVAPALATNRDPDSTFCTESPMRSLISGARSFDGRVQRQNVRLERDPVDHPDDVGNAIGAGRDGAHRGDHFTDHRPPLGGHIGRTLGQFVRLAGIFSVLPYRCGEFLHRRRSFFQIRRLLLRTLG